MSSGGSPGLPPGWAPTLLEPVAVPVAFKPHSPVPAPEPNLQDHIEDTRWLLESAQAEADGLCEEIRRLARVSVTAADAGGGGRTSPEDEQGQFNQAHHIYRVVEEELVRLRQQHEEYLEQREQEQQAAILEQRDALRAAQQRLRTAQELGEAEGKARAEAERAKLSAEESLGRLGLEVVRLREREAVLLEELSARRSDEGQRIKQNEEIKSLRTSLAAERRRREDAEAISRERFEEIRQAARTRKEAEELAEESRQHSQERWRKQRSLERENRQLRERLQTLQEASIELNSVRMEIEEAHEDSHQERTAAAQARRAAASQEEAFERTKRELVDAEEELKELREASAQLRQESLAESVASRALTTQLSLSENRIHELCRELVKAETAIDSLQEGAQSLAALKGEAEQHKTEIKALEANVRQLQGEQLQALRSEAEALRSAELRGEASADEAKQRLVEESDAHKRRAADLAAELQKERGRRDQMKRQLQDITDERDEVLAKDWQNRKQGRKLTTLEGQCAELKEALAEEQQSRRTCALEGEDLSARMVSLQAELQLARSEIETLKESVQQSASQASLLEEFKQQKEYLEADRSLLWSELQQQCSAHGEIRQQAQHEQRSASSEVQELRQRQDALASELQELQDQLDTAHAQRSEAHSQAQLHEQLQGKMTLELQELRDELSEKEAQRIKAQSEADAQPADATALRLELDEARSGARDLATSRRKQGILHKQQLDNMRDEHREAMKSLQQQHVQQLTVQQHMLDPNRLSTMVDELLDEIGSLRHRSDVASATRTAARREAEALQALRAEPLHGPASHAQARRSEEASAKLQRMRQRLADLEGSEDPPTPPAPAPAGRRPSPARRASPARITYTLEPVTSEAAAQEASPSAQPPQGAPSSTFQEEPEVTMLPEDCEETLVPEGFVVQEAVMQDRRAAGTRFSPRLPEAAPRMPPALPTPIQRQRLHVYGFQSRLKQVKFEDES